jgi:valyl-tRNA synthetase
MNDKFTKPYDPSSTEGRIYKEWEKSGFFNPDNLPDRHKDPFTIIMPPPNANGDLHVGHSLFIALEDIMTRYKRMQGYKALWIPGADHAGFETQIVYEKKLEKEGRSRFKMDPQDLYKEIYDFTITNKSIMENQVRSMGASCDWSREKFTLDPDITKKVGETFKKMFDDGLIYRGNRMVNWCTKHQTSLSDVETETKEMSDKLYYIKYGPLTVATVRPETMFGDVAVAVNPTDERYKSLIGKNITIQTPIGEKNLLVVGDEIVEKDFGTGALKITPAHDKNDFELAERHGLPSIEVIDKLGKLNEKTGKYNGIKIVEARKQVVTDLESLGLIEKIEGYTHPVPTCYKCNTTIEPRQLPQWYVKMKPLADMALKAVGEDRITFYSENYKKIFTYWMQNTIDWNISRQIVWGIQIPAKICTKCGHGFPDLENTFSKCIKCEGEVSQDTDTFDTWFSSGQWPLLTLGFPDGKDFKKFYPTNVMETGDDLIFKWIPRMVIFGLYLAKDVPFKNVYMHGLVNDSKGKKMSKSKGNVINPLDMTAKYGTDALRMALVVANPPGSDTSLDENKIKGYKNFANKIWNISRFVFSNTQEIMLDENKITTDTDKILIKELSDISKEITSDFDEFRFHLASEKIYHYIWNRFADVILEESKPMLSGANEKEKESRQHTLLAILKNSLITLHPFMPFITEEIWSHMPCKKTGLLMIENWTN